MADKKIRIHLAASADLAALRTTNAELAKIAMSVGRANDATRQAALASAREWALFGGAADRAGNRAVLSARQIEEAWRKAMSGVSAKPAEEAARGFGRFGEIAKSVLNGVGGKIQSIFSEFMRGGIWGLAAKAFCFAWEASMKFIENRQKETYDKMKRDSEKYASSLKDALSASVNAIREQNTQVDRAASRVDAMTNSVKELTKAEIELAKQRAIANGMSREDAARAAADLSTQVEDEAEETKLRETMRLQREKVEQSRKNEAEILANVEETARRKSAAEAEYQRKREEYVRKNAATLGYTMNGMGAGVTAYALSEKEVAENRARAALDFENSEEAQTLRRDLKIDELTANMRNGEKEAAAVKASIADTEDIIARSENALAKLDLRRAAREQAALNDDRDAAEKAAKEREEADARVAEAARAAEVKAAEDTAKERDRLDRELHRRRMDDLRAEIAEQQKVAAPLRAAASAARGAFDRAFAMYRDPSRAAAEIGEEKAYARDLDRLHADARRYGGSWRIDELARLMASGDAEGQTAALAEWRKSRGFTPQVEAMVRASAAERAKTTAEDELRKIEANTAGLADKLDSLLAMKGGE